MIEKIRNFVLEAGQYAINKKGRDKHNINFKWGEEAVSSMVTEVDLHISKMFRDFVEQNFSHLNYMIIDEESLNQIEGDIFEQVKNTEYQFILDPIDGTINYAADIPLYGVLVSVFKHGKPLYGFMYAPDLEELVYTDGKQVYYEHKETTTIIPPHTPTVSRVIQGHPWAINLKPKHFSGKYIMQDYFSAAIYLLYLVIGKVKGVFVRANIWDVAPALAICKVLGMGFYDYYTGEEITEFSEQYFRPNCQAKTMRIACFKEDFETIKSLSESVIELG